MIEPINYNDEHFQNRCEQFIDSASKYIDKQAVKDNIITTAFLAIYIVWQPWDGIYYKRMNYPYQKDVNGYKDDGYLQTYYWRAMRLYKLQCAKNKCETPNCKTTIDLTVHHTAYRYVGEEHLHFQTLQVFCKECHTAIHSDGKGGMLSNSEFW